MLCVASEYVAMTTPRLYRASLSKTQTQADRYLREQTGLRYSRYMVSLFFLAKTSEHLQVTLTAQMQHFTSQLSPTQLPRRIL